VDIAIDAAIYIADSIRLFRSQPPGPRHSRIHFSRRLPTAANRRLHAVIAIHACQTCEK
jgi:hypothetical protein